MLRYLIFDTETTGLNIMADKPFLFQYGIVDAKLDLIKVASVSSQDLAGIAEFKALIKQAPVLVGHNIKFDIHMCLNFGFEPELFADKQYIDTAWLARLVLNHDHQSDKSFSIALKKLAVRYLGISSGDEEQALKAELSSLTIAHKRALMDHLKDVGVWPATKTVREDTRIINELYNSWNKIYHKYDDALRAARNIWMASNPAPTYEDCNNVVNYGETDIYLTHGLFKLWYPRVVTLKQVPAFTRLNKATWPLVLMERQGLAVDVVKVLDDRAALLKEYESVRIIDPRDGVEYSVGQHAKLKDLYEYESGVVLNSSDRNARMSIIEASPSARKAEYLSKMSKYINTYITGVLNKLTPVGSEWKIFTQYNMAGTITGRLSSDFQQFPRDPLVLDNGHVVDIRSWFIVPQDYKYMFYFDYSQLELRLQCEWTAIVNGAPDINLARAFSPYKTVEVSTPEGLKYYLEEDTSIEWSPIDLHGLTAKSAFAGVDETHPSWKHYRDLGKRANFACNYGAAAPKIQSALDVTFDVATALVNGYKKTYSGVIDFGKFITRSTYTSEFMPNLFLRRYYSRNKHQLNNWLVQGSGADLLLLKLQEVNDYIKDKPHWKFMITVHDEIGFVCADIPEALLIKEVEEIKQLLGYSLSNVDIIADVEVTTTSWSAKEDW